MKQQAPSQAENEAAREQAIRWAKHMLNAQALVADFETTGTETYDEITQLVITDLCSRRVLLVGYCQPVVEINAKAAKITGITPALVQAFGRPFGLWYPHLYPLLAGRIIVAYNAEFDSRILTQTCARHGLPNLVQAPWECAMLSYGQFRGEWNDYFGNYRWHKLVDACKAEGLVAEGAHDATFDTLMTVDLIHHMAAGRLDTADESDPKLTAAPGPW